MKDYFVEQSPTNLYINTLPKVLRFLHGFIKTHITYTTYNLKLLHLHTMIIKNIAQPQSICVQGKRLAPARILLQRLTEYDCLQWLFWDKCFMKDGKKDTNIFYSPGKVYLLPGEEWVKFCEQEKQAKVCQQVRFETATKNISYVCM
jgi:hypothetical protein